MSSEHTRKRYQQWFLRSALWNEVPNSGEVSAPLLHRGLHSRSYLKRNLSRLRKEARTCASRHTIFWRRGNTAGATQESTMSPTRWHCCYTYFFNGEYRNEGKKEFQVRKMDRSAWTIFVWPEHWFRIWDISHNTDFRRPSRRNETKLMFQTENKYLRWSTKLKCGNVFWSVPAECYLFYL